MDGDGDRYNPDAYSRRAAPEKAALLPEPGPDDVYKAAGVQDNYELARLVLVMGKDGFKAGGVAYYFMQYVHIGVGEFGFTAEGLQFFRFIYGDLQPKLVTVYGRNLLRVCDYISLRRMPWIREADRDFRKSDNVPADEPIILKISVVDWQPEQAQTQEEEPVLAVAGSRR